MARRVRRRTRGGRVVDVAGGHGLLAFVMLLLDRSSTEAIVVDPSPPASSAALHEALSAAWPRLPLVQQSGMSLESFDLHPNDVVVSCHACGALTDRVLDAAVVASARVAVLPCCHEFAVGAGSRLDGWIDPALAIDVRRALDLERRGYAVWTQTIPPAITPEASTARRIARSADDPKDAAGAGAVTSHVQRRRSQSLLQVRCRD